MNHTPADVQRRVQVLLEFKLEPAVWTNVHAALVAVKQAVDDHDDRGLSAAIAELSQTVGNRRLGSPANTGPAREMPVPAETIALACQIITSVGLPAGRTSAPIPKQSLRAERDVEQHD